MVTGTENTLKALLITKIEAAVTTKHGSVLTPNEIDVLADGIAFSVIPHFVANVAINPGTFNVPAFGPVLGVGAFV